MGMRTRFAPTPSGFPHLGNAVNALLCARLAAELSGELLLRVDDADLQRHRMEYRRAIFELVEWLDLPIASVHEHQDQHGDRYWNQLIRLAEAVPEMVYVCSCTRSQLDSGKACLCSGRVSQWRIHEARVCMRLDDNAATVLWRRDGIPAYHLTSVVDDDRLGVTHVIRGDDLQESTIIQRQISHYLPGSGFADTWVAHHALVLDQRGNKLSKSSGALSAPLRLDNSTMSEIKRQAAQIWESEIVPLI